MELVLSCVEGDLDMGFRQLGVKVSWVRWSDVGLEAQIVVPLHSRDRPWAMLLRCASLRRRSREWASERSSGTLLSMMRDEVKFMHECS